MVRGLRVNQLQSTWMKRVDRYAPARSDTRKQASSRQLHAEGSSGAPGTVNRSVRDVIAGIDRY